MSTSEEQPAGPVVSFAGDILPLFTQMDIDHMKRLRLPLDDYSAMSDPATAQSVYEAVSDGSMPPSRSGEPPWSPEQVDLFKRWMDGGYQP